MAKMTSENDNVTVNVRVLPVLWALIGGLIIGLCALAGLVPAMVVAIVLMVLVGGFYWSSLTRTTTAGHLGTMTLIDRLKMLSFVVLPWAAGCSLMLQWNSHRFWGMLLGSIGGVVLHQLVTCKMDFSWLEKRPEVTSFPFDPSDEDKWRRYHDKKWNFAMLYPSEWEIIDEDDQRFAVTVGHNTRRGRPWFRLRVSPLHIDLEEKYFVEREADGTIQRIGYVFDEQSRTATRKPAGDLWYRDEVSIEISGVKQHLGVTFLATEIEYLVYATAHLEDFEKLAPFFLGILNSLSIGSEPSPLSGVVDRVKTGRRGSG